MFAVKRAEERHSGKYCFWGARQGQTAKVAYIAVLYWSLVVTTGAMACSTSLTVNLTVQLAAEHGDVLIELREGVVGHSRVVNRQKFRGLTGTVYFTNLCAGSYFMDIGNGSQVAVTPVHQFGDGERRESTIRVSFTTGNVSNLPRSSL